MSDLDCEHVSRVCVAAREFGGASHTFIRDTFSRLGSEAVSLSGRSLGTTHDGEDLLERGFIGRLSKAIVRERWQRENDRRIAAWLRSRACEVVLCEYGPTGIAMLEPCRQAGVPLVVRFHGYDAYRHSSWEKWGAGYQRLFREAAAIVGVSRHLCAHLIARGAPNQKVHWIACGANEVHFADGCSPAASPPRFLMVGRLVEKKAPLACLEAFKLVLDACPAAELRVIGAGPLEEPLRARIAELGLEGQVALLGALPHEEIPRHMARCRAFIQHSVTAPDGDGEGTPVSVMEAQLCGLPVVSTRHHGIPEVIKEGETGLLVDEHDVRGMSVAMLRFARSPELAAEMGRAARAHALQTFSLRASMERLQAVLRACCS